MTHTLYQVDAFTSQPFKGNPAAVCVLQGPVSARWMQSLAAEMNLSETAYLLPQERGWRLRWFTPKTEVDLCGHATLASARVLFELHPKMRGEALEFHTRSGLLLARWKAGRVELDFPAMVYQRFSYEGDVCRAIGFEPVDAVFSGNYCLFVAKDEEIIKEAAPNISGLLKLPLPEVIITAKSTHQKYDFISRFFAPQLGVDEDPVTGSAHCLLAPYWAEKLGKKTFTAYQASKRGGELHLEIVADRVRISGQAKFIFKAVLLV